MNDLFANSNESTAITVIEINNEPRIKDIDLGKKLGFERPRAIRQLIERMIENGQLNKRHMHGVKVINLNKTESTEYYLNEKESLRVIRHCDTKLADQVMEEVIDVFIAWRHGKLKPASSGKPDVEHLLEMGLNEIRMLKAANESKALTISQLEPVAEFGTKVLDSNHLLTTTTIAKQIGTHANLLNNFLHKNGVIFKQNGCWYPYAKYEEAGYHRIVTTPFIRSDGSMDSSERLKWTQSGRRFIFELWEKKTGKKINPAQKLQLVEV